MYYFSTKDDKYDKGEVDQYTFELMEKQDVLQSKYHNLKRLYQKDMEEAKKRQIELEKRYEEVKIKYENIKEEKKEYSVNASKKKEWLGDVAFYGFLAVLILAVFLFWGGNGKGPKTFAGFSAFTVLTSSMEDQIPKKSIVVTRYIDPNLLKTGDNITYMSDEQTTITHQIIDIRENFQDTGQRAFETKGTMNEQTDQNLVPAGNVVGKVVFHNLTLGKIAIFIRRNWPLLIFFAVIFFVLEKVLRNILDDEPDENRSLSAKA